MGDERTVAVGLLVGRAEFRGISEGCTLGWPVGIGVLRTKVAGEDDVTLLVMFMILNQLGSVPVI